MIIDMKHLNLNNSGFFSAKGRRSRGVRAARTLMWSAFMVPLLLMGTFSDRLGYDAENWNKLKQVIIEKAPKYPVLPDACLQTNTFQILHLQPLLSLHLAVSIPDAVANHFFSDNQAS